MRHDHGVTFYDHDGEAIGAIARYVVDGLSCGDRVILIATDWHVAVLEDLLHLRGVDLSRERSQGRVVTLDAAQTLELFMVDGAPDRVLFAERVGGIVAAAGQDGTAVRAFGEMVALLWEGGDASAALVLEGLWNELAETHSFGLLCAYPTRVLDSATLSDISVVCGLHTDVGPPVRYSAATGWPVSLEAGGQSEIFLPVAESVAAARGFVANVLGHWGASQLSWAAGVITSELATNAAVGQRSPFRVGVGCGGGVVRIGVEDISRDHPQRQTPTADDTHGRGMVIVETLARRWGCQRVGEGKVVWAELASA